MFICAINESTQSYGIGQIGNSVVQLLTDVTGLSDTLGGFYFREILWKEVNTFGIVLKSLSLTHTLEVVSFIATKEIIHLLFLS